MTVWMQDALSGLMQSGLAAGMAALAVALICRLTRPAPSVCHLLWLLVLVRLLMPPLLEWPWVLPAESIWGPEALQGRLTAEAGRKLPLEEPHQPLPSDARAESHSLLKSDRASSGLLLLAGWVWLIGSLAAAAIQFLRAAALRRSLLPARPADDPLVELVHQESARMNLRPPDVLILDQSAAPFVSGLRHPRLYWPAALQRADAQSVRPILVHELAHLKRRDLWAGLLEAAALCLWWWSPLPWLVRRRLREYSELACDAWAVCGHPQSRRSYARSLLELSQPQGRTPDSFLQQLSFTARASLERRLRFIYSETASARFTFRWAALAAVLWAATLPAWTLQPSGAPPASSLQPPAHQPWQSAGSFVRGRIKVDERLGVIEAMGEDALVYLYTQGDDPSSRVRLLALPRPGGGIRLVFQSSGEESAQPPEDSQAWLAQALHRGGLLELLHNASPPLWRGRSYIDNRSGTGWRHSNLLAGDYVVGIWVQGEVRLAAGGSRIEELTPSSTLLMLAYRRDDPAVRLLEWSVAADGRTSIRYSREGHSEPFDASARAWFSPLLRELAGDPVWSP